MLHAQLRRSMVRLTLCTMITALFPLTTPPAMLLAQPAEAVSARAIPIMGIRDVTEGALLFRTTQPGRFTPAPILKTDVHIAVTGIIARTILRQEFMNPSREKDDWAEGIYVFPLPETAAVDHLRMKIGERIIEEIGRAHV